MVVQHNLQAMNANRMLGLTSKSVSSSTEKLSSGYQINRAADNAAGLAISEKMRKQIRGLGQASINAEDGISAVQTAEGALNEVQDMLQRMNELAVQSANGTNSSSDRQYIQDEIDQLVSEIDRVAETTKFNETYLLKGDTTAETKQQFTTDYSITVTKNVMANNIVGASKNKINYTGTSNIYMVSTSIYKTSGSVSLTADKISTGKDITEYFDDKDTSTRTGAGNVTLTSGNFSYDVQFNATSYVAFVAVELNSDVTATAAGTTGKDLYTDSSTSIVKASQTLYIYDTSTGTVTHKSAGDTMTAYLNDDNTMKDQYRLVDIYAGTETSLHPGGATGNTGGTTPTDTTGDAWTTSNLALDESKQRLYNADGQEVSGMALNKYFDESGNYTGGLFTTSQARMSDKVFSNSKAMGTGSNIGLRDTASATIGHYISQSSTTVAGDIDIDLQVGADSDRTNKISASITSISAAGLGVDKLSSKSIGLMTADNATDAIDVIADALTIVSRQRASLGAVQNRLEHTISNLDNVVENTTAAESQIRDTDMANEMVKYSNANILQQAGQSMLAQANQSNQGILSLLQ